MTLRPLGAFLCFASFQLSLYRASACVATASRNDPQLLAKCAACGEVDILLEGGLARAPVNTVTTGPDGCLRRTLTCTGENDAVLEFNRGAAGITRGDAALPNTVTQVLNCNENAQWTTVIDNALHTITTVQCDTA